MKKQYLIQTRKPRATIADLERDNAALFQQILDAINILDGNADPIDWRDGTQPELLRKLCEHLDAWKHGASGE